MKIALILTLALALVALASNCVAFTPTSEDMAWRTAAINDSAVIKSDVSLAGNAVSARDIASTQKHCDLLAEDAGKALRKSQGYTVSPEFQNAKNYYEQGLSSFQIGAHKISQAVSLNNPTVMKDGMTDINKGSDYVERATRELSAIAG